MEFLRFGSSIPGSYWGCCAADIIQNFKVDPDEKYAISIVDGDGGNALTHPSGGQMFVGMTYKKVFEARIRFGTFGSNEMPNHAFFAVLTAEQISGGVGKKWLAILRKNGFEFLRTVDNSVYSGEQIIKEPGKRSHSCHKNYVFALFRNIGTGAVEDAYVPPKEWTSLPRVNDAPEHWESIGDDQTQAVTRQTQADQLKIWSRMSPPKFYTRKEVDDAGCEVWLAGERSSKPQRKAPAVGEKKKTAFPSQEAA